MERLKEIANKITDFIDEYKGIVIGLAVGGVILILVIINMGYIQVSYYRMTEDTNKIINVLSKDVKEVKNQQKLYFASGITYLMEDMSSQSMKFFEKYFKFFNEEVKLQIIEAYNQEEQFFESQTAILENIAKGNKSEILKEYVNRLDLTAFELALKAYFGQDFQLTQDVVTKLYNIASMYNEKLPMDKFKVSIYELMMFPQMATEDSIAIKLLEVIEPAAIHKMLFTELKTQQVDVDILNNWIDILNKNKVIDTQEYASFTNSYNSIKQLRDEYTQLQYQEVDIKNIKQRIDIETTEYLAKVDKAKKEIEVIQKDITNKHQEVADKKKYKIIELYVMDYYEDGTCEASIPEKSWFFGTYKPSDKKVKLKLSRTQIDAQGVFSFEVYYKGESEEGIPYYIEVSEEEKQQIVKLESDIRGLEILIEEKQAEILKLKGEVDKVRKANNYEQNNRLLEEVTSKKESVALKIKERQVEIQNLFGLGNITIELDKK